MNAIPLKELLSQIEREHLNDPDEQKDSSGSFPSRWHDKETGFVEVLFSGQPHVAYPTNSGITVLRSDMNNEIVGFQYYL